MPCYTARLLNGPVFFLCSGRFPQSKPLVDLRERLNYVKYQEETICIDSARNEELVLFCIGFRESCSCSCLELLAPAPKPFHFIKKQQKKLFPFKPARISVML